MNREISKLKKIISNLSNDKESIQGKRLNEIMNQVRNKEITFKEFLNEFKTIV